ncbi:PerC family transcriptional regulator [Salmonella enterica]
MIYDEKAEKLEQAGLYRRAAARWLTVPDRCRDAKWHLNRSRFGIPYPYP